MSDKKESKVFYTNELICGRHKYYFDARSTFNGNFYISIKEKTRFKGGETKAIDKIAIYPEDFNKLTKAFQDAGNKMEELDETKA